MSYVTPKMIEVGPFKLLVDKADTVEGLLEAVKAKIKATPLPPTPTPAVASPPAASPPAAPANGVAAESPANVDVEMKDAPPVDQPEPETHTSGKLRLVEVFNHKISKVFANTEEVKNLNDYYSPLYAEEIPLDQASVAEEDQLVNCFHFHKDPYSSHGIPFIFLLKAVGLLQASTPDSFPHLFCFSFSPLG